MLHLSEHAAYRRIEAARTARRFPMILDSLADGGITLTTIGLLAPHLTAANHVDVLAAARHKPKRAVERLVAQLQPRPDVASAVRKLPQRTRTVLAVQRPLFDVDARDVTSRATPPVSRARTRGAEITPLTPERYKIQFTVGGETHEQLRQIQDLLRHVVPDGDPAPIFARGLKALLAELAKTRLAAAARPRTTSTPRAASRHIPAAVKRQVWGRDGGRCAFKGTQGRCTETGFLEFHHRVPFADGGETTVANLELRCRAHNAYEATLWFGPPEPQPLEEARESYGR